jgi:hypothetical protein
MAQIKVTKYYNYEKRIYICNYCHYTSCHKYNFIKHLTTEKHNNAESSEKVGKKYESELTKYNCKICEHISRDKYNFIKHLNTKKHKSMSINQHNSDKSNNKEVIYKCHCGKLYKHSQSLYRHSKGCKENLQTDEENKINMLELKNEILELKNEILNMSKNIHIQNASNNTISNSFNNKNEIKIFLTEKCANAISIQEFVRQLTITMDDLHNTRENTVMAISGIIERNLKPLSITNRPIHHIEKDEWFLKDKEEWKEDDGNTFIDKACNKIQKDSLKEVSNSVLTEDDYLKMLHSSTAELSSNERIQIKETIKGNCKLVSN